MDLGMPLNQHPQPATERMVSWGHTLPQPSCPVATKVICCLGHQSPNLAGRLLTQAFSVPMTALVLFASGSWTALWLSITNFYHLDEANQ